MPEHMLKHSYQLQHVLLQKLEIHVEKNEINSDITPYTKKITPKLIKDLNVKPQKLTLIEDNMGRYLTECR